MSTFFVQGENEEEGLHVDEALRTQSRITSKLSQAKQENHLVRERRSSA